MAIFDDFSADPSTTGELSVGGKVSGVVDFPDDRDWFRIFLFGELSYRFNLDGESLADPTLFLRDESGTELAFNDDANFGLNSEIVFTPATNGIYFLDAGSFDDSLGSYVLTAENITDDDFADTITTTGEISVGGSSTGVVGSTGDRDWFRIVLNAGGTYRFNLDGITLTDPTLFLRDASGAELAFNDDTFNDDVFFSLNSEIIFTATATGTYFLDAGPFGEDLGSYVLTTTTLGFVGTDGDDTIIGGLGDDTFFGSAGNDSYEGLSGTDTIDYSSLGQRVTLKSQGVIEKAGGFGTDTIVGVERIIGTLGKSNLIDGRVAGPQATSFDVNLATNNLTVNGIPGIGSSSFFVQNFTDVRGTRNNDIVVGDVFSSVFFGSSGNDSYDGACGIDTIDYSSLGQRVTLKSQGVIEKAGGFGTDTIVGVERIIGTLGKSNFIDGRVAGRADSKYQQGLASGWRLANASSAVMS
ncbi:pre-peptidase C-terminal domain-containing protein [Microcystis elabens FACHB-917]|nr:pre-peptidase C-terminal domain-containing protein [Microcystis elabens FACHB-917]